MTYIKHKGYEVRIENGNVHCNKNGCVFFSMRYAKEKNLPEQCPKCKSYKYYIPKRRKK